MEKKTKPWEKPSSDLLWPNKRGYYDSRLILVSDVRFWIGIIQNISSSSFCLKTDVQDAILGELSLLKAL